MLNKFSQHFFQKTKQHLPTIICWHCRGRGRCRCILCAFGNGTNLQELREIFELNSAGKSKLKEGKNEHWACFVCNGTGRLGIMGEALVSKPRILPK